ncbi:hypothetical protein JCM17960_05860 [Magnetospira thiophila]
MKITATKSAKNDYLLTFDDTRVPLNDAEVKLLLAQLKKLVGGTEAPPEKMQAQLLALIKAADDLGLQALLQGAESDDVLILLKVGEADAALRARLFNNMSNRARQVCEEDMAFKFKNGVPQAQLSTALARLTRSIAVLKKEGRLQLKKPAG